MSLPCSVANWGGQWRDRRSADRLVDARLPARECLFSSHAMTMVVRLIDQSFGYADPNRKRR
jgi:hypothetical protein